MPTETREVQGFDQVALREYGELIIEQGDSESLVIEAEEEVLSKVISEVSEGTLTLRIQGDWLDKIVTALTSAFSERRITYHLTVRKLTGLKVFGAAKVTAERLNTDRLALRLGGAGTVNISSLTAEQLEVDLPGAGTIHVGGKVGEQRVVLSGAGTYRAPRLESQRAAVKVSGVGTATVWAVEELDVAIGGIGSVEYYGSPQVKEQASGIGRLTPLGNP